MTDESTVLVTGAGGMVGRAFLKEAELLKHRIVATDLKQPQQMPQGVVFQRMDVTTDDPDKVIGRLRPDVIIHLASIVTPPKGTDRDFAYRVDVEGTQNVLEAALKYGVRRLIVTSSGAAYGYHPDNSVPLSESDPIRGNEAFAYSHHKRLVEEMLADARRHSPSLEQVIFRVGTILGEDVENQITALFRKPRLLAIKGHDSPFVFIWTKDLARILTRAVNEGPSGIFNVSGDGAMTVQEIAKTLGKPVMYLPAWLLKAGLAVAKPLGLTQYGPEQVRFLQYRPVLENTRLKEEFGYVPELSSKEVFALWQRQAGL